MDYQLVSGQCKCGWCMHPRGTKILRRVMASVPPDASSFHGAAAGMEEVTPPSTSAA